MTEWSINDDTGVRTFVVHKFEVTPPRERNVEINNGVRYPLPDYTAQVDES